MTDPQPAVCVVCDRSGTVRVYDAHERKAIRWLTWICDHCAGGIA